MKTFQTYCAALCVSLLALALGCSGGPPENETSSGHQESSRTILKGHAVFGHEVRTIRPCAEEEALWAIDSTQALWDVYRELAPGLDPYEEVFVVVRGHEADAPSEGFGVDYTGSFVVDRVLHAAAEGFGCELNLDDFSFRISGNEPFWTLNVIAASAKLSRMDGPERIWTDMRVTIHEDGMTLEGSETGSGSLEVAVREEPCRDSMSGAFYAYRASVLLAEEELQGCALFGTGR